MNEINIGENIFDFESGSEEIYKDLFDNAHDLIHFVKPDGTLLYVNNAWMHATKYTNAEIKQKSIYTLVHEDDKERFFLYRSSVLKDAKEQKQITIRLKTKDGETIFVEGNVSAKWQNGEPLYTRGIFRDVTEKVLHERDLKAINKQLRKEEENLKQLIQNAPDAVIVIDEESRINLWNPKAEQLFGWKADEVIHSSLADKIIPLKYREAHAMGMKRYLSSGEARVLNKTIEITAINKQEEEFYVALTISSCNISGQTAFISFIRNITEEKENQLELERKTVALERSNANLEEFVHAASHDLKEPIRKVLLFSDRLKKSVGPHLSEEDKKIFERLEYANKRMSLLIDDLLEYAHVSFNPHDKEKIDLNNKLKKVLEDLELVIEEKGAEIKIENLPVINGYRRQLQQLFYNLVGNSLKYSKDGMQPLVTISSRMVLGKDSGANLSDEDAAREYYLIEVSDNGIGFSQEYAERIFNMFQRLHGKSEYSGTGVGLSIARKVVHNHNGHIWAESRPGEGAKFKVIFPAEG